MHNAQFIIHNAILIPGYDGKGNITTHHTAGQYGYGTARPYAFNELMTPSSLIPQREQHISFNAMQQPDTIREGSYIATLSYYGDMTRAAMTVTDTVTHNVETRTYYDQQYNEFTKTVGNVAQTKRILWLGGTSYNAPAALVKRYGEQNWTLVHVLRDNLGSITHVVDTTGVVLQEMSYSTWGLLRDPATLEPYAPDNQPELLLGRGYTGHEHLPWFGLVNMNARLYDPAVGRFLSPDPLVQAPNNTQNYNRYSYCLNNPLRFMDEKGEMWVMACYRGELFFFYDYRVNNQQDIMVYYSNYTDIQILDGDVNVYTINPETKEIVRSFTLYASGYFTLDGVRQYEEYNQKDLLHIGTSEITPLPEKKEKGKQSSYDFNWHGYYLGPDNPKTNNGKYSYAVPPINYSDYGAFNHDGNYDNLRAEGLIGVLSLRTRCADLRLAYDEARNPDNTIWSFLTFAGFGSLGLLKHLAVLQIPILNFCP